jgi:hypothetical protein
MADPVFGSEDRVNEGAFPADLMAQLEGKDIKDHARIISKYYKDRENSLLTEARKRINQARETAPNDPPRRQSLESPTLTKEQVWNDPVKVLNDLKTGLITKEEFTQQTASAQKTIIRMAEQLSRQDKDAEGQRLWMKYRSEINGIMNNLPPDQQADPAFWDTAFNAVMGNHLSEIRTEAVKTATTIAEPGQPESEEAAVPEDLSTLRAGDKTALDVCAGLGITGDRYRKAKKEMYTGTLGMTLTNVGR